MLPTDFSLLKYWKRLQRQSANYMGTPEASSLIGTYLLNVFLAIFAQA